MKIAFSRPTTTPDEQRLLMTRYREIGFDGLQLKARQYMPYIDQPARFRDEWGQQPGVASGLITAGRLDEPGIAALRKLIGFAAAVHAERIIFCHSVPRAEVTHDDIRAFARTLSQLGREARQAGVALSLHHHFNQPVMHREDIAVFCEIADPAAVGLTIDTAHLVKSGIEDVAGVIRQFRSHIDNFHLKDFANGEWRVLGQGAIDFAPIFHAIGDIGFAGWLCADEESGGDLLGGMAACHAFIQQSLAAQTTDTV